MPNHSRAQKILAALYRGVLGRQRNDDPSTLDRVRSLSGYYHGLEPLEPRVLLSDVPFGLSSVISDTADGAVSVFATDVDGDGDTDVLSASFFDDKIAWYENDGADDPSFTARTITTTADGAHSVFATDEDGDIDALSASRLGVAWHENLQVVNDNFASRIDLGSEARVKIAGTNIHATGETGEPTQAGELNSAWWAWTAPADGTWVVDTIGSNLDTFLTVATESAADFALSGVNVASYAFTVSYDALNRIATLNLDANLDADTLTLSVFDSVGVQFFSNSPLDGDWDNPTDPSDATSDTFPSGDGVPGGDFVFKLRVLPGDSNGDGKVDAADLNLMALAWQQQNTAAARAADLNVLALNWQSNL